MNFTIAFPEGWETSNQPYTVSAIHENRQAGIFVGLEDPSGSPEEYRKMFEQEIKKSVLRNLPDPNHERSTINQDI